MGIGIGIGVGLTGSSSGGTVPTPTIASVSQNGGTINGSTALSVTGSNFQAGMTSGLGTVSAITGSSCTVTTGAHAAGSVSWTLTNSGGSPSASQTYTYLAHPGTPSASPAFGSTASTTSTTFTSSGLPYGLSGVPFSATVGGSSVTSLSATASTTATGTVPSGLGAGANDIVVTVDGVSATGSGAWTAVAPPTITAGFLDFMDAAGGESRTIPGTNLAPSVGTVSVTVDGVSATGVSSTSTSVTFTTPASAVSTTDGNSSASTVTITTAGGSVSTTGVGGDQLWYLPHYKVAGTVIYSGWNLTKSGSNLATIIDSANGTWTATLQGASTPTVTTGGGINGKSPQWVNANQNCKLGNTSFTAPNSSNGHWFFLVEMTNLSGANRAVFGTLTNGGLFQLTGQNATGSGLLDRDNGGTNITGPTLSVNTWSVIDSYFVNSTAGYLSINGGTPTTGNSGSTTSAINGIGINGYLQTDGFSHIGGMAFAAYYGPANLPSVTGAANMVAYLKSQ